MKKLFLILIVSLLLLTSCSSSLIKGPTSLTLLQTWKDPITLFEGETYSHGQGVATDDTYIWYSGNSILKKTYLENPDWSNPLAVNLHALTDGSSEADEITGITLKDNYIYTTASKLSVPYRSWVKWYNKDTLAYVGEKEVYWTEQASSQEGPAYYGGYWWIVYFDSPFISQYDSSFSFLRNIVLPKQPAEIQGQAWYNGQLWISTTKGPIRIYDWNGENFGLATTLTYPPKITNAQSFSITPDGQYLYWADFIYISGHGRETIEYDYLHKLSISWRE